MLLRLLLFGVTVAVSAAEVHFYNYLADQNDCNVVADVLDAVPFPTKYYDVYKKKIDDAEPIPKDQSAIVLKNLVDKKPNMDNEKRVLTLSYEDHKLFNYEKQIGLEELEKMISDFFSEAENDDTYKYPIWVIILMGVFGVYALLLTGLLIYITFFKKPKPNKDMYGISDIKSKTDKSKKEKSSKSHKKTKSTKSSRSNTSEKSSKKSAETSSASKSSKSSRKLKPCTPSAKSGKSSNSTKSSKSESSKKTKGLDETNPIDKPMPLLRDDESRTSEPVNSSEFKRYMSYLCKLVIEYYQEPEKTPVTTKGKPGFIFNALPKAAPEKPEPFLTIVDDIRSVILPGMTHWNHPQFHAFFQTGRCYPDIMGEFVIATLSCVGYNWESCPALTELEQSMANWLGRAFGLPESHLAQSLVNSPGGGSYFNSASESILCAMMVARNLKIKEKVGNVTEKNKQGIHYNFDAIHGTCKNFVAYASNEAHSCFEKACKMCMVRCRTIPASEKYDWGITGDQLEKDISKDAQRGMIPFFMVATLGTTSTAVSDHLLSIARVCEKYGMWLHVDAAYGGSFWVEPKFRSNAIGLEMSNSIVINMHKAFLHSNTCSVMWTKNMKAYREMFTIVPPNQNKPAIIDLRDCGMTSDRRFRCLKTFFIMRHYGISGLRHYINKCESLSILFEELISSHPNCRMFGRRQFALFAFQYYEPDMSEAEISIATGALCKFFNSTHRIYFTRTKVGSTDLIRVAVGIEPCHTKESVLKSWSIMQELIGEFKKNKYELTMRFMSPSNSVSNLGEMHDNVVGSANALTDRTLFSSSTNSIADSLILKKAEDLKSEKTEGKTEQANSPASANPENAVMKIDMNKKEDSNTVSPIARSPPKSIESLKPSASEEKP